MRSLKSQLQWSRKCSNADAVRRYEEQFWNAICAVTPKSLSPKRRARATTSPRHSRYFKAKGSDGDAFLPGTMVEGEADMLSSPLEEKWCTSDSALKLNGPVSCAGKSRP